MREILLCTLLIHATGLSPTASVAQEGPERSISQEKSAAFRFLTPGLDFAYYPTWAPDGQSIAFSAGEGKIMRVSASGGTLHEIIGPEQSGGGNHPSWSPDGNYVAFDTGGGSGVLGIRVISIHGGPPIQVVPPSVPISRGGHPAWSPDGSRIAFSSMGSIMVLELGTGTVTSLYTPDGGAWARAFGWSPDGSKVSMDVGVPDSGESDVWILTVGGGPPARLTDFPGREGNPVWSPDGSTIAFMAGHSGNRDIWIMPAEGGKATQITFDPGMDMNPRWSPDGMKLAFASDRGAVTGIWVVDLEMQLKERTPIR
jgi:Tol biopolymer transport system component